MITFNSQILKSLFGLIGETAVSIQEKSGVGRCTVSRAVASGDCKVTVLVDLCNAYHMSIAQFFTESTKLPDVSKLFVEDGNWSPVEFHPENIPNYTNKPGSVKCSDLVFKANVHRFDLENILVQNIDENVHAEDNIDDLPWAYSDNLFKVLPSVLQCSVENIGKRAGRDIHTYLVAMQRKDIRVRTLLDICNTFSIPIDLFFQREGRCIVPCSIVQEGYTSQRFYPYRVTDLYGKGKAFTYEDLKAKLGYNNPKMIRMMAETTPITACELARLCNITGVEPSWFFRASEDHAQKIRDISTAATMRNLENKIAKSDAENARLKSQIRHMEAMNELKKI